MTDFTRQTQDMFAAAKEARIPENVQQMAEESVLKTREAYNKMTTAAKDSLKVLEELVITAQAGAKSIGEKVVHNTAVNTEAAFDAAQAIARAKTLHEAARLQVDYLQQQMAVASAQTKELLELSTKVATQAFNTMNAAAAKSMASMKKSA